MATTTSKKTLTKTTKTAVKNVQKTAVSAYSTIVYGLTGEEKGQLALPKEVFGVEVHPKLMAQYVRVFLANKRQGNASTKTRGEVTGSTRKIYRQKGTGKARHGSIKAPIFVGGGVVGGPLPKDYSLKMNKKQKKQVLFGSLSMKLKEKKVIGFSEEFLKMEPKTKLAMNALNKIKLTGKKLYFVLPAMKNNPFLLAVRNVPETQFVDAQSLNAYDVLRADQVVFVGDSLSVLTKHFLKKE